MDLKQHPQVYVGPHSLQEPLGELVTMQVCGASKMRAYRERKSEGRYHRLP
jgi:hypothetical protein